MNVLNSGVSLDVVAHDSVTVVMPSNLYGCTLEEGVFIGPFCEIQSGSTIGAFSRVQSHTFVCSLVLIGRNCFIGHGVMFVNDKFSEGFPARDKSFWMKTSIGDNVSIGSNATILPVEVCSNVVIGAGSVVTKDIREAGFYAGNPAVRIR